MTVGRYPGLAVLVDTKHGCEMQQPVVVLHAGKPLLDRTDAGAKDSTVERFSVRVTVFFSSFLLYHLLLLAILLNSGSDDVKSPGKLR